MTEIDARVVARRAAIIGDISKIVGADAVIDDVDAMRAYESDALTAYRQLPFLVVLPRTTAEIIALMRYCHRHRIKIVPRGAGTSLSGGALPLADGIVLAMGRFNKILSIDYDDRACVVQPGVTNLAISHAVAAEGFYFAPDPSSQLACSIGGNVAENAGGVHCLKYGVTSGNILSVELVLITGEVVRLGGAMLDCHGYDLLGVVTGSEGLLGVMTEITVRILRRPECAKVLLIGFPSVAAAGAGVSAIIAEGIIPAALEMMDRLAVEAVEDFVQAGYPTDAAALLLAELDGPTEEVDYYCAEVERIARESGATVVRRSADDEERMRFWAGRKAAFPAVGRITQDYLCMDGTIPRHRLPEVLEAIAEMSRRYGLRVANVFHAGDGNLHPLILYNSNNPGELEKAEAFGAEILKRCVAVGGVLTGEHGVGVEKRGLMGEMFSEADLKHQQRVKCAFDSLHLMNPGKVFPVLHRCAELGHMHVHRGALPFPHLDRL